MTGAMATAYVDETLRLRHEAGLDDALIARATGAARSTVRDWFARRSAPVGFFPRKIAKGVTPMIDAFSGVRTSALSNVLLDVRVSAFFFRRKIAVRLALFNQPPGCGAMFLRVVGLEDHLFVVVQTQPLETFEDRTG